MMKLVLTSETSVRINLTTWRYIPEDSKLQKVENLLVQTRNDANVVFGVTQFIDHSCDLSRQVYL
jgi:hypothetical protein